MGRTRGSLLASLLVVGTFIACSSDPEAETPPNQPIQSAPNCGRLTTPCESGGACEGAADCKSNACSEGKCQDIIPPDGQQNNGETDVDCGGAKAAACDDGKKCAAASDCKSSVCTGGICQAPSPTDGVKNGDETGKDCGGSKAPKCPTGEGCASTADCADVKCDDTTKKCGSVAHDDGIKNGDETGIDCGGPTATKKCPPGEGCAGDADCDNTRCDTAGAKTCNAPTKNDGLQNGTETDVDCGGGAPTNADRCKDGKTDATSQKCDVDGDCESGFCSFTKHCVTARSCKGTVGNATAGITTCGRFESTNAAKEHESCCRSLPLPTTTTVRLDKYEVTAGRIRQFVESIPQYNIRQWVKTEIQNNTPTGQRLASDIPASMRDWLPASANPGDPLNLVQQLGGSVMDSRTPSDVQGCYNDDTAYGHNTYWWDAATLKAHFTNSHPAREYTKAQYDEKSINCSPYWLYAAFCAWDGGRMPTVAEVTEAWGAKTYPWNSNTYSFPVDPQGSYEETANYYNNNSFFYGFPAFGTAKETAGYIAAPGRFIKDKTFLTSANGESWMDLGANMMEMTKTVGDNGVPSYPPYAPGAKQGAPAPAEPRVFCDFSLGGTGGNGCPNGSTYRGAITDYVPWVGGSWEGHYAFSATAEPYFAKVSYNFTAQTQYGKTGVRCAR